MARQQKKENDRGGKLRVAWLTPEKSPLPSRLGLTLCPGREDHGRDLDEDIQVLKDEGTEAVIGLITDDEMRSLEVEEIAEACQAAGIRYIREPILDENVPSPSAASRLAKHLDDLLERGIPTVIHCVGGLGRTGTVACMALIRYGASADEALKAVRAARGPEAVENDLQEEFVRSYST